MLLELLVDSLVLAFGNLLDGLARFAGFAFTMLLALKIAQYNHYDVMALYI